MDYRRLGRSGLKISPLCLGTMMFGAQTDEATAKRIIARAREQGVNFIDTADAYAEGRSEEIVGRAIKTQRDDWVVATKLGLAKAGNTNVPDDSSGPITVYGNFQRAGNLALPALAKIDASRVAGNLMLAGLNEPLAETGGTFPLLDKRDTGAAVVIQVTD